MLAWLLRYGCAAGPALLLFASEYDLTDNQNNYCVMKFVAIPGLVYSD